MKEFFRRTAKNFTPAERPDEASVPDNLWVKCPSCRELIYQKQLNDTFKVCPKCGYHMRLSAREWLNIFLDEGSFEEFDADLLSTDPLGFTSPKETYAEKLIETQERTGLRDSVISGRGTIEGQTLVLAICDFNFMGGSMGSVYGEKMARAAERAAELRVPLLTINTSGGARMHEGIVSLMQMAKITLALTRLAAVQQPHISLLVDPCYGGVLASYASIADIIIAEPGANIGFAGRRVVDQTIKGKLPSKHQTAEFLLEHGMIDIVSPRGELRGLLQKLVHLYNDPDTQTFRPDELLALAPPIDGEVSIDMSALSAWDRVQLARHQQRPHTLDFVRVLCKDFVELHGDRRFGDDPAIVSGVATFGGRTVMVIGHQKGSNTRENVQRHFGMSRPEGYRKAQRMFQHAEKFGLPVLCFIDTPGADPERESEERGQANAIAECILTMADLKTPIISVVIGEGNSGGAIAIGVADRVLMLENAIYMVVSPEGCASILWRGSSKAPDAAEAMRITAQDVYRMGIADEIIPEPTGGAHSDVSTAVSLAGEVIGRHLAEIAGLTIQELLSRRYDKYRAIGQFHEVQMRTLNGIVPKGFDLDL